MPAAPPPDPAEHVDPAAPGPGASLAAALTDHPSIQRVRAHLAELGATGEVRVLPDSVRTAAAAAASLGCEVGAIANSLVFDAEGTPVLILTSGAHRVDTERCAVRIDVPALDRAKPDFVRTHTGQVIGGVAPVGHPTPLRTYVDPWLDRHDEVWASAGHPNALFCTTYSELLRVTGGEPLDVEG
ncbi:MAG TPA: YbaK/EbsC family protein [Nocardioidaceae bacterium]|nr:YbaK/EbsC family protein [Nocardioidaceae bacterium]